MPTVRSKTTQPGIKSGITNPKAADLAARVKPGVKVNAGPAGPLWEGPCGGGPNGGITQSMMKAFLDDRERFRLKYVEGWSAPDKFDHRLEYGHMWHACEEALAKGLGDNYPKRKPHEKWMWETELEKYVRGLLVKYPMDREQIDRWYKTCQTQFPVYVKHWADHSDVVKRTPIFQEQVFDVPYELPSRRTVRLRGKFDAVDLITRGKVKGVYLQENKTKGDIDEQTMHRQLKFDLQLGVYLIAINRCEDEDYWQLLREAFPGKGRKPLGVVKGARYNVVRRPFSGGKGNIKRKEGSKNVAPETEDEYWSRLQQYFIEEPQHWFMRWNVEVSETDVRRFEREFLQPFLEQLCDWYAYITVARKGSKEVNRVHWTHPYSVFNSLDQGYAHDLDALVEHGTTNGLVRRTRLFSEL